MPAPFDGTIVACNERLLETPHRVSITPYGDAWIVDLRADDPLHALDGLVTGAAAVDGLRAWIDRYGWCACAAPR